MNPGKALDELLCGALERPAGPVREAWLESSCDDPDLRADLRALCAAHESAGSFLSEPLVDPPTSAMTSDDEQAVQIAEGPGTIIGNYRLLDLLGSGGFGAVYRSSQETPVKRTVALKILKLGMDTRAVIARFETERQVLAIMDHPGIARVFDAGATDTGRPYFVMELVDGEPITRYCDRLKLSTARRLDLFTDVCRAVQHAHQKGIIHRDLKPGNILVTEAKAGAPAQPKVIDFGIAKATEGRLADHTLTAAHRIIGTPAYMSPEQAGSDSAAIDTRSDIFSLGVVLYELLTGTTPIERKAIRSASPLEIHRMIREDDPPKPSTRVSAMSGTSEATGESRDTDTPGRARSLRGDLDWIVMRCLAKDPASRYATALELAADIERHLANEPVLAGPPSRSYRLAKFVRRNRLLVSAVGMIAVTLVAATVFSLGAAREARDSLVAANIARESERQQTIVARTAARVAETEAAKARQVADFTAGILTSVDPAIARDLDTTLMRMILDEAGRRIAVELGDQPEVGVAMRSIMGSTYMAIAEYTESERQLESALELARRELGDDHPETLSAVAALARLRITQGRVDEAEGLTLEAWEGRRQLLGDNHAETLDSMNDMGVLYSELGRWDEAEDLLRKTVAVYDDLGVENSADRLAATTNLVSILANQSKLDEAEKLLLATIEGYESTFGDEYPPTQMAFQSLCHLYMRQGKTAEAEACFRESRERFLRTLGDQHPTTWSASLGLGQVLRTLGRPAEAETEYRRILPDYRRVLGDEHPKTLACLSNLALALTDQGKVPEAEAAYAEALAGFTRVLGEDHNDTLTASNNIADLLMRQGKYTEAEPILRKTLAGYRKTLGDEHTTTLVCLNNLATLLRTVGRLDEAEPAQREALEGLRAILGNDHASVRALEFNFAALLEAQGRLEEAATLYSKVLMGNLAEYGAEHGNTVATFNRLNGVLGRLGRADEAAAIREQMLESSPPRESK